MKRIKKYFYSTYTEAASLAAFRVIFGVLMLWSLIRFVSMGWVEQFYIAPKWHFTYYGFSWVQSLGVYTYGLFAIAMLACVAIIIGFKYRLAILVFFLTFTYIELIDKTTYLNHYYFISILSFLLCFLPLNATFSWDSYTQTKSYKYIPVWTVDTIKILLSIVYFYAGLSKLNSDWLLRAQPLKIWLSTKTHLPLVGSFMNENWFHYAMSWSGALYDLCIPFLLWNKKTRRFAFVAVVIFHLFTRLLFNIGMFPYIMICACFIFFESSFHVQFLKTISRIGKFNTNHKVEFKEYYHFKRLEINLFIISLFLFIQLFLPFRYLCYPGELFWTEQGFRFSWRVMLIEKVGIVTYTVKDKATGAFFEVDNRDFLTSFQIKQMSFQPDFILEYAHMLGDHFKSQGHKNVQIFAECYVALNGRLSREFINPNVDLYQEKENFNNKTWITPINYEIKGF